MPDGTTPGPGGWNRIHRIVADIAAEVARFRHAGVSFRNRRGHRPGGSQILLEDPAGNVIELFQPAGPLAGRSAGGSDDTADTDDHEQDEQEDQR